MMQVVTIKASFYWIKLRIACRNSLDLCFVLYLLLLDVDRPDKSERWKNPSIAQVIFLWQFTKM